MEIILVEKIKKLGEIGAVINVKDGFARNFLIPQGKAIRATASNKLFYEERQAEIIAENKAKSQQALKLVEQLPKNITLIRQAAEDTRLFGSVNARDIANAINELSNLGISKASIANDQVIKYLGVYKVAVNLHAEVSGTVVVTVSRTIGEAEQALASYLNKEAGGKQANKEVNEEVNEEANEENYN